MIHSIALFGEAQKGEFRTAYYCKTLHDLSEFLGEPPSEAALGLHFAVQALLYRRPVLFFRVHEEGFHASDYLHGLKILHKNEFQAKISAICLPGVGDAEIIEATDPICALHRSFLIITEKDLYDYLTN